MSKDVLKPETQTPAYAEFGLPDNEGVVLRYDFVKKTWSGHAYLYDSRSADIEKKELQQHELDYYLGLYDYVSKGGTLLS